MQQFFNYQNIHWRYPGFKAKALTLSYDDGREFDRQMVEILDRHGIRCTFNLNSAKLGDGKHVTAEELETLYRNHEVAVHTLTHPLLQNLTAPGICWQIIEDRKNLEDILHRPVEGMAYPYGLTETPGMIDAIKSCGIRYARATTATNKFSLPQDFLRWYPTCHQASPQLNDLIERFLAPLDSSRPVRISPKLLYIWGHSYEYEYDWEPLERMCEKLSGHDDVWYTTNGEIIDYIEAMCSLRSTVDGRFVYNPTHIPLYLWVGGHDVILQPGCTTEIQL